MNVREDDHLISVVKTNGQQQIFLSTRRGHSIRFEEATPGRWAATAQGVIGIRLRGDDSRGLDDHRAPTRARS